MDSYDLKENECTGARADTKTLDSQLASRYEELVSRARNLLRQEREGHTLQTSALIHEAYLRMLNLYKVDWKDHSKFLPVTVGVMRRVLVDHARNNKAKKRGGDMIRVEYHEDTIASVNERIDVVALDHALERLAERDALQASIVEHRYFGGLSIQQTGTALGLSPATIKRKWVVAQAWLYRELKTN